MRTKLRELVEGHPCWDGRVASILVTNADKTTIEVRALVSAANSSLAWDLRCHVRETMLAWLRDAHPNALPKVRADVNAQGDALFPG